MTKFLVFVKKYPMSEINWNAIQMLNKRVGPMSEEESVEQRELYKQLRERIKQLRMKELFEEPSTYEDELE